MNQRIARIKTPWLLLAALAWPGLVAAAEDALPSAAIASEGSAGVVVEWTPGTAAAARLRLALPAGVGARIAGAWSADGRPLPARAVSLDAGGWRGLEPHAELTTSPALLGGASLPLRIDVRWTAERGPEGLPPGLRTADSFPSAEGSLPLDAWLRPAAAAGAAEAIRARRDLRPAALERAPAGRPFAVRAPVVTAAQGSASEVELPRARAAAGFSSGERLGITIAPDAPGRPGGPGLYRLTHALVTAQGLDLAGVALADLRLVTLDVRSNLLGRALVPLWRHDGNADGLFGAGDWIEFWGEPMDGESHDGEFQRADFTDERTYVLDVAPDEPSPMMPADLDGTPVSPVSPDFLATARAEVNDLFLNATRTGERGVDHFYWCSTQRLAWYASVGTEARRTETLALPRLAASSPRRGTLRVRLLHRIGDAPATPDHRSLVDLNGRTGISDLSGDGYQRVNHVAAGLVAGTDLRASNTITLRAPGAPGAVTNLFELDWIEADYPRTFDVDGERLVFTHEAASAVTARGLTMADVAVLDVTVPFAPRRLVNVNVDAGSGTATFEIVGDGSGAPARMAVQGMPAGEPSLLPARFERLAPTGLRGDAGGDVLVVGPRAWVQAAPLTGGLERWRARREAEGMSVRFVATEDAIAEFAWGTFTPAAIAGLVAEAFASWTQPPGFVLLLGDTSLDYKNLTGGRVLDPATCASVGDPCSYDETAWVQHVPTRILDRPDDTQFLGWYASDVLFALAAGTDWDPDVVLGRIPARSDAEIGALLDKVLAYEDAAAARPAWGSRAILVADQIEVPIEQAFEDYQDAAAAAHLLPRWDVTKLYYQRDHAGDPPEPFTQEILDTWRDPARAGAVTTYVGHGSAYRWSSDDILLNRGQAPCRNDVEALAQAGVPETFVINANCITGTYVYPLGPSLLEELVRSPEGGAIAAFGPTGVTELGEAQDVLNAAFGALYGRDGRQASVADAIRAIQSSLSITAFADPLPLLGNAYLGDPTLRLAITTGPAAISLAAAPGDALVDLSWPAVAGAATYALWRSDNGLNGTYEIIADGLTGTSHRDTGDPPGPAIAVVNNQLYHYALEPLDAAGNPGRWSARVAARPCSLAVPAAAGPLTVTAGACSGSFTARWSASPTPGLQGYRLRVYRGARAEGVPVRTSTVPGVFGPASGLVTWQEYTFTVNPVTWCGVEGPMSGPVTSVSTCPLAIDPPAFITDLRVRRQGTDVLLDWSPVTETVRGTPATIATYRVHRADDAAFLADASTTVQDDPATAMTDPARIGSGSAALEFYAVAAVDSAGRPGGVAHDFPQGARNQSATNLGAEWELTWTPVRFDIRGEVSPMARYLVYASDAALGRARIETEGLAPVATVAGPPARVTVGPGVTQFFVVPEDVHGNRSAD